MNNVITITIKFDFRGKHFNPSAEFDLDEIMRNNGTIPDLHYTLASLNNIDHYSYEFEIMLAEEMQYSHAQGYASEYLHHNLFDKEGFSQRWHAEQQRCALQQIARQHMNIETLAQHPELHAALNAAYQLGRKARASGSGQ